jgi:hypothetical protein
MARWLSPKVGYGLVAALYLFCFPYHPALRSPNELCRLWQSRSLVDHGTVVINETLREFGMVGDLSCVAKARFSSAVEQLVSCVAPPPLGAQIIETRYYPSKAPMLSFLGAPIYAVLKTLKTPVSESAQVLFSRLVITVVPTLLMLVFLRRFLRAFLSEATTDTLVVVYALGTLAFSYSEQFLSHQLTAVLLFATFFCAWRVQRSDWTERGWLVTGFFAGSVVLTEYTGALGVVSVAAYVVAARWTRWRELGRAVGLVVLGAAPFLIALMAYHQVCFGHPLSSGYMFLNDASYQGWHLGGFLGIRYPDPRAFALSAFSPLRGFFTLSPFLLLTFLGLSPLKAKDRAQWVMVLVLLCGNAYFTSSFTYDSWGWTTGPRHLTPLIPFLVLPVGLALERLSVRVGPAFSLAAGLCVSSVLVMSLVTQVNYVPNDLEYTDAQGNFHISTSLFGLVIPLLQEGVWPVSWSNALVPNPAPGMFIVVMVLGATAWVFSRFRAEKAIPALVLVSVVAHLGALAVVTTQHSASVSAKSFLKQSWAAPSGQKYAWW